MATESALHRAKLIAMVDPQELHQRVNSVNRAARKMRDQFDEREAIDWSRLQDRLITIEGSTLALSLLTLQIEAPSDTGTLKFAWLYLGIAVAAILVSYLSTWAFSILTRYLSHEAASSINHMDDEVGLHRAERWLGRARSASWVGEFMVKILVLASIGMWGTGTVTLFMFARSNV